MNHVEKAAIGFAFRVLLASVLGIGVIAALARMLFPPRVDASSMRASVSHAFDDQTNQAKDRLLTMCRKEGRVPVMGFGTSVACLNQDAVKWEVEP